MLVLWQVGLGAPWWRHLVLLRFIDFNKCNSSHCKDSCLPKAEQILATGRTSDLQDLSRSFLVTSWLWWTQPTAYCQSRILCKIYRAQIYYRDWMGLLAEGAWLCEHMNPTWFSWMIGQHCNRLQQIATLQFKFVLSTIPWLPISPHPIQTLPGNVWKIVGTCWHSNCHESTAQLSNGAFPVGSWCPLGCCTPFCWGYGNWRGCCC